MTYIKTIKTTFYIHECKTDYLFVFLFFEGEKGMELAMLISIIVTTAFVASFSSSKGR